MVRVSTGGISWLIVIYYQGIAALEIELSIWKEDPSGLPLAGLYVMQIVINKDTFINDAIILFLNWKASYAPYASNNYRIWLERFSELTGNRKITEYSEQDVAKYLQWLRGKFSPYSIQLAIISVKNLFGYLHTKRVPCLSPDLIKTPRTPAKSHQAVTEKEFEQIISKIPNNEFHSLRDLIIIRLLWDTGCRVSELCDLDLQQIDSEAPKAIIQTRKNNRNRIIMWSKETHNMLLKYLPIRKELFKIKGDMPNSNALFVGWKAKQGWSQRLTSRSVQRIVKSYVTLAGIPKKITPHSFRHGWANQRRDQGAPLSFIQKGLGHSHPLSTFIYQQYNDIHFEQTALKYLN